MSHIHNLDYSHDNFDFNGLNNNQIFTANVSQTPIILSMSYDVDVMHVTLLIHHISEILELFASSKIHVKEMLFGVSKNIHICRHFYHSSKFNTSDINWRIYDDQTTSLLSGLKVDVLYIIMVYLMIFEAVFYNNFAAMCHFS